MSRERDGGCSWAYGAYLKLPDHVAKKVVSKYKRWEKRTRRKWCRGLRKTAARGGTRL